MKIQLIILGLFVVATLAHRHRDGEDENQVGRRRHYRGRRRDDNQVAANAEDAELEDNVSSDDETVTEAVRVGRRRGCGKGSRRGGRRGGNRQHEHDPEWQQTDGDDETEGERKPFVHNPEWHEQHGRPMPDENSETERKHHRHHKHHHHHHHHNRTTTTSTPSPTTSDPSSTTKE